MAAPLKTAGLRELEALRKRTKRQLAMERINKMDGEALLSLWDQAEGIIQRMREEGEEDGG